MQRFMTSSLLVVTTVLMSRPLPAGDPLSGEWVLNRARSHYGLGAEPRQKESFDCQWVKKQLRCSIESVRMGGRSLTGRFIATYDGKRYPSSGIPDVDEVSLTKVDELVGDAIFSYKGSPVFGYRAFKSDDGRHLTIVSVDPVSRKVLRSVITYDHR